MICADGNPPPGGPTNPCPTCDASCFTCLPGSNTQCASCTPDRLLVGTQCQTCPTDQNTHVIVSGVCQECDSNCATCQTTPTTCLSCQPGFYVGPTQTCIPCDTSDFTKINSNGVSCLSCTSPCKTCEGTVTTCKTCIDGYWY